MTILDFFIVNVAIPSIQEDLRANAAEIQLVVAGYGLAYAIGLITGGRLGDIVGRRRMFAIGLLAFVLSSAACGLAPTATMLVAARVLQGLSAAMLFPQVLSILNVTYTGRDRAPAFTAFGVTLGLAAVCGQLIGGLLIYADVLGLSWRSCFLINVPVGLAALALTRPLVPESRSDTARKLDLGGVALSTVGLVLLLFPLVQGRQAGWPAWAFVSLALSVVVLALFVRYEWRLAARGGAPLVEPKLFGESSFVAGITIVLAFYAGLASLFLVLAVYLQEGERFDALRAGVTFVPLAVGFFLTSVNATRLAKLFGRQALAIGAVLMALSYAVLIPVVGSAGAHVSGWSLAPGLLLNGLGEGAVMGPIIALVLAGVKPEYAGSASGVLTTVQQIAGALGVAVIGIIFYGALGTHPQGATVYAHAFQRGMVYTLVLVVLVAVLVQFLPKADRAAGS
ncbi:MFS transporter [Actinoplanes oblitus]|uniref:MFS transporter n=1 Tax=Actinoplanes oblitus TaxID=3040509 RepID=A0ABY8W4M7_9ACTN|nr:MFS transporter [Actinoplanes oblitus]WIM92811.1 MFS transporter [Actinoplanes oblitus]